MAANGIPTPNFGLPQFLGDDLPDFATINSAFQLIDSLLSTLTNDSELELANIVQQVNEFQSSIDTASNNASNALSIANSASGKADTALSNASNALGIANSANDKAASAITKADTASGTADTAYSLAQAAQTAAAGSIKSIAFPKATKTPTSGGAVSVTIAELGLSYGTGNAPTTGTRVAGEIYTKIV